MPIERVRIVKDYLVLCEGRDAENFLIAYLNSDALSDDKKFGNDIQVLNFGGISDLPMYLRNLRNMDGFDRVRAVLVVRDAETDVQSAEDGVRSAFGAAELPVPASCCGWNHDSHPSVAYALFPSCNDAPVCGALEDLCWKILAGDDAHEVKAEVQGFISDVAGKHPTRIVSHDHKCRLHTYFSTSDELVSLKIGEAAKAGAFDWQSSELDPLKRVLQAGF